MLTWALLLAAGSGTRFGQRKQYLNVGGRRMVDRVVDTARQTCDGVVLVLPEGDVWSGPAVDRLVTGGPSRAASVRAGLAAVPQAVDVILIHDAAHPLASPMLFAAVLEAVGTGADAAVPVLPVTEVIKRVAGGLVVGQVPREGLVLAQSPQAFVAARLRAAHARRVEVVEDSELILDSGGVVVTVPGEPGNVHVTTFVELGLADRLARACLAP